MCAAMAVNRSSGTIATMLMGQGVMSARVSLEVEEPPVFSSQSREDGNVPLRLVHGWGLNSRVFSRFEAALAMPTQAINLPGHGRADYKPGDLDPRRIARSFARDYPGAGPWLGWSLGGLFAMALAAYHPESVTKLILVSATPCFVRATDWPHGTELKVLQAFGDQLERDYEGTLRRFLALQAGVGERGQIRELVSELGNGGRPQAPALVEGLSVLAAQDMRAALERIRAPTLFIHGADDKIVSPEAARWSAQQVPGARFCQVGSGHAPFLSETHECVGIIRDFLNE